VAQGGGWVGRWTNEVDPGARRQRRCRARGRAAGHRLRQQGQSADDLEPGVDGGSEWRSTHSAGAAVIHAEAARSARRSRLCGYPGAARLPSGPDRAFASDCHRRQARPCIGGSDRERGRGSDQPAVLQVLDGRGRSGPSDPGTVNDRCWRPGNGQSRRRSCDRRHCREPHPRTRRQCRSERELSTPGWQRLGLELGQRLGGPRAVATRNGRQYLRDPRARGPGESRRDAVRRRIHADGARAPRQGPDSPLSRFDGGGDGLPQVVSVPGKDRCGRVARRGRRAPSWSQDQGHRQPRRSLEWGECRDSAARQHRDHRSGQPRQSHRASRPAGA
jgi:hypothetical protein